MRITKCETKIYPCTHALVSKYHLPLKVIAAPHRNGP